MTGAGPSGGATGEGTGTVNALFMKQAGYSEDDIAKMVGEFEEKNPDIDVEPTFVSYEALHDKIVTAAPAGTYDVFLTDVIWPAEFASKGIAADLTGRIPENWKKDVLGGALDTAKYEDKYYGVPLFPSTKLFYYNKELVASVGASEKDLQTWDGVLKVAEKIKAKGEVEFPLSWSWSQAEALVCDYAQLLGAFGGQFTGEDGKLAVNSPEGVAALQWMMDSVKSGVSNPSSTTFLEDDVTKSLAQGQTAFALNWESTLRDLDDPSISKVVGKIGVMQTPAGLRATVPASTVPWHCQLAHTPRTRTRPGSSSSS
ncbi:trehalose/maltose-binding protein MalE [Arthrobacter sp. Hiyo4]|nr:trehalose/maltose-binding protein MalE [Arthrobacter sp. Hiyo4]